MSALDDAAAAVIDDGLWLVYGLLANREHDHDLRFIEKSEKPQAVADAHPEFAAVMAFPEATACQLTAGAVLAHSPALLLFGARWQNAAERAGR